MRRRHFGFAPGAAFGRERSAYGAAGGFGAADPMYEIFQEQLLAYRKLLVGLYRQKSSLIAEREALRFQYAAGIKTKITSAIGSMLSDTYLTISSIGMTASEESLLRLLTSFVSSKIPMVGMTGAQIGGWGYPPGYVGGPLGVSYLSPIQHIISDRFNDPAYSNDLRPAYQIYSQHFTYSMWSNPEQFLKDYFLNFSVTSADGTSTYDLVLPFTRDWVANYLRIYGKHQMLLDQLDSVNEAITTPLSTGRTFVQIVDEAREMVKKIIVLTQKIVQIQLDIDKAEAELAEFVQTYKDSYAQGIVLEDYVKGIEEEAAKTDTAPVEIPAVASEVQTMVPVQTTQAVEAPKSKLPWIAAAVVGAVVLSRK